MCSYFMLILVSSKMFRLSVFFFSSITLMQDRFLLHANSNSLSVGENKDKAHGGANLNTRVYVRCLIVLPIMKFLSIMRMAFLVSILFQQEHKKKKNTLCMEDFEASRSKITTCLFMFPKKKNHSRYI